jgi:hypothetical protein
VNHERKDNEEGIQDTCEDKTGSLKRDLASTTDPPKQMKEDDLSWPHFTPYPPQPQQLHTVDRESLCNDYLSIAMWERG